MARLLFNQLENPRRHMYSRAQALALLLDVARGLAHMHKQNPPLVHRDVSGEAAGSQRQAMAADTCWWGRVGREVAGWAWCVASCVFGHQLFVVLTHQQAPPLFTNVVAGLARLAGRQPHRHLGLCGAAQLAHMHLTADPKLHLPWRR